MKFWADEPSVYGEPRKHKFLLREQTRTSQKILDARVLSYGEKFQTVSVFIVILRDFYCHRNNEQWLE